MMNESGFYEVAAKFRRVSTTEKWQRVSGELSGFSKTDSHPTNLIDVSHADTAF